MTNSDADSTVRLLAHLEQRINDIESRIKWEKRLTEARIGREKRLFAATELERLADVTLGDWAWRANARTRAADLRKEAANGKD